MKNNRTERRCRIIQTTKEDRENCREFFVNLPDMGSTHANLICDRLNATADKYTPNTGRRWLVVFEGYNLHPRAS